MKLRVRRQLHGTGTWSIMPAASGIDYRMRSAFGPATMFSAFPLMVDNPKDAHPWDWQRRMLADWRRLRPLFVGDFYPRTPYQVAADTWLAYQMDRPDLGQGCVLAFRRHGSMWTAGRFTLGGGVDPATTYVIEDLDDGHTWTATGKALLEEGIDINLPNPDSSRIFIYRRRD